ncbi:hypothetical protein SUGI_0180160 [Cryptomeria japonica]|nr:hypothetical protein SUGI_0180160 [Cryptomeria japonica]
MATKVEQTSLLERHRNQSTASPATTQVAAANSPKISMRAVKAGVSFVIPKNKLSGALVPVVRGGVKAEKNDSKKDEEVKQPLRKTKWGIDLTQDAAVRRGRALAYQTRVEQIAAQLELGNLEIDPDEATRSPSPPPIYDKSGERTNTREARKREQLDLERREAIGECLRLNPNYKPPAGYISVSKEAKISIPVKESLGQNFVGLILGPQGNTKKRLEEETGTKITIKSGAGDAKEGMEIDSADFDGKEIGSINEDLHVHISADTYEKVDAAVSLLELLMTPVDGNIPPAGPDVASSFADGSNTYKQGAQVANASHSMLNADLTQNYGQPTPVPLPGQQPMHHTWPSSATGATANVAWQPSASITEAPRGQFWPHPGHWQSMGANNNAMQSHSGPSGAPNAASYVFRGRPPPPGFTPHATPSNVRNTVFGPVHRPRPPFPVQQRPYVEMASQNHSAVMNPVTGVFGNPHLQSQSSQAVHRGGTNASPLPPSSNTIAGGGYGPHVSQGGVSASAPLPVPTFSSVMPHAVPSQVPITQPYGLQQQQMQLSRPPSLASHAGSVGQVSMQGLSSATSQGAPAVMLPSAISPMLSSSGLSPSAPQGSHASAVSAVAAPVFPSPGLSPAAPRVVNSAIPSAILLSPRPPPAAPQAVRPAVPSPRLPPTAPQRAQMTVPHVGTSAVLPSPGLPPPTPRPVHVALPPLHASPVQSIRLSVPQTQSTAVAVPPVVPSPVPPMGNILHTQPPKMDFMSQGSSAGLASVAIPVVSTAPTPTSIASGMMHSTVATMQSSVINRPNVPTPISASIASVSSQGTSVPSSASPNTWQPQHLRSGDFTFQPLRSQAPSPPPSIWPPPSQPPLADVHPKNHVPIVRPGFQPAVPNLSHPGQIRVSAPLPPTPSASVTPSVPPMPPLPPQAPSFRPAVSVPSLPPGNTLQPTFSVPLNVSVSPTTGISPPKPGFLNASQQMPARPPGLLSSAAIPSFGSPATHTNPPLPPHPRPQSGPDGFLPFPPGRSVPDFHHQGVHASTAFQNLPTSNISVRPTNAPPPGAPLAALPRNVPNQFGGSAFGQQQNSPAVFPNISTVPTNNVKHNHINSPQVQLPSSPQVRSIVPGQMHDFGYGGQGGKTLPATREVGSNQSYDPFSPTSIPAEQLPPQNDQMMSTVEAQDKQETDAEYENLMESVGVR